MGFSMQPLKRPAVCSIQFNVQTDALLEQTGSVFQYTRELTRSQQQRAERIGRGLPLHRSAATHALAG
jgi:hypothetical protein